MIYIKKILNLIQTDFITMNGGKNNIKVITALISVVFTVFGFIISPLSSLYVPLILGAFFVPMLFQNEIKYHNEKMFSLLPIERKDLVRSRFILSIGLYVIISFVIYLLMLLSLKLKLHMVPPLNNDILTELGLFNLLYFTVFSFGLMTISSSLRKHFKDSDTFNLSLTFSKNKKIAKQDYVYVGLILAFLILWALIVSDILPGLDNAVALIIQILIQLAEAADGFLLGTVMITIAVFSCVYKYTCTILEYEEKEL